jgi:hypothetical protein
MPKESLATQTFILRAILAASLIILAAALRILPLPWNFTPIGAMALFSGAMFRDRRVAFLFPLAALFAGDLFVGLHRLIPVVYASFLVSVLIGTFLANRRTIPRIGGAVFLGALQFFLITNFAVWKVFDTYPHKLAGLAACYIAGSPCSVTPSPATPSTPRSSSASSPSPNTSIRSFAFIQLACHFLPCAHVLSPCHPEDIR